MCEEPLEIPRFLLASQPMVWAEWFPMSVTVLTELDQTTIAMLRNLIANIEAGNVTVLDRSGHQCGVATAELTLMLKGHPDITLK